MRGLLVAVALMLAACDGTHGNVDGGSGEPADGGVVWCQPTSGDAGEYFAACSGTGWQINCGVPYVVDAAIGGAQTRCVDDVHPPTVCRDGVTPVTCVPYPYCPDTPDHACDAGP